MSFVNLPVRRASARFSVTVISVIAVLAAYNLVAGHASMQSIASIEAKADRSGPGERALLADDGTADPTFNPAIEDGKGQGTVSVILPDGKILVGGGFAFTNGVERGSLARLNADGSIDTSFNPGGVGPSSRVYDIALLPSGQFILGGTFASYNGTQVNGLARINADGTLDTTFNSVPAGCSGAPQTVNLQSDGKILISGSLNCFFNATTRFSVVRFNSDGSLDTTFTSPFTSQRFVEAVAVQPDGKMIIAGSFPLGTTPSYSGVARLNANGSLDTTFNNGASGGTDNAAYGLALQSDGKILITGDFQTYNGVARTGVARLNADGTLDTGFTPPSTGVYGGEYFDIQIDGKIVVAGRFVIGGAECPMMRLNTNGTLDGSFQLHSADALGYGIRMQPDGKIVLSGYFNFLSGTPRRNIVRFNPDGTVDGSFNTTFIAFGSVSAIAQQPDGKIIAAGNFERANGAARSNLARFNLDGSLDPTFTPQVISTDSNGVNNVRALALQPDGKVLIGGNFATYQGAPRHSLARLNSDGTLDPTFVPVELNAITTTVFDICTVNDLLLLPGGKVLVGGSFQTFSTFKGILRLNADGSTDNTGFSQQPNGVVSKLLAQPDGKIIVGGSNFTTYNSLSRQRIARVNADGTLDTSFNPTSATAANGSVSNLALRSDGKILISGAFTTFNGTSRPRIARLNSDGTLDTTFTPGTGANGTPSGLSLRADGKIIIGGTFSSYNGAATNRLARLNADGTLDATFVSGFDNDSRFFVSRTLIQSDGNLLFCGTFKSYGGSPHLGLARAGTTSFTLSGQVTSGGSPLGGVDVALTGSSGGSARTDANGNYLFTVAAGGTYTVTPSLSGRTFSPPSQTFASVASNQTQDFAANTVTYSVSGNVKANSLNLGGATVSLSNGVSVATTTTDGVGNYSFAPVNPGADYSVSVVKEGYLFDPSNQSIPNLQSSQTKDFLNGVSLCTPPPGDQVAWFRAEGNGTDSSGAGNGGSLDGPVFAAGKVGQAFNFDNSGDRVNVIDSASLTPQTALSIDLWVKPAQITQQAVFVSKYDGSIAQGRSYYLGTDSTGSKVQFAVYQTPGDAASLVRSVETTNSVLTANVFTHITAVFDGVTQTQKIYINGVDAGATVTGSDTVTSIADSVTPLRLGEYTNASGNRDRFFTGLLDEVQIYGHALTVGEAQAINTADLAGLCSTNVAPTPPGNNVTSNPTGGISLNFQNVSGGGTTVATPLTTSQLPALPQGFTLSSGGPTYEIHTSASYSGPLVITFNVPNVGSSQICAALRILHYENGSWTSGNNGVPVYNAQTSVCTVTQTVTSLSPFAVAQSVPTAAGVTINGRVMAAGGRGIQGAKVTLTGSDGRGSTVQTGARGSYQFANVRPGQTYVLSVGSRTFRFDPSSVVITVSDSMSGMDFTGTPTW